ncbi:hypothetical protein Hanom_Chr05g00456901 [Helianthus anomalus]
MHLRQHPPEKQPSRSLNVRIFVYKRTFMNIIDLSLPFQAGRRFSCKLYTYLGSHQTYLILCC